MIKVKVDRKWLCITLLAAMVLLFALTSPVFAYLYRATLTVSNNSSITYDNLAISCLAGVDWLTSNGFITTATALDTRVETSSGVDQLHMMANDRIMTFSPTLNDHSQLNWYLSTGNTPLSDFPIITGYEGYVTITDDASLEPSNNFKLEFEGWLSHSVASAPIAASTASSTEDVQTDSHVVDLPSGVEAGDLLIMLFTCYDPEQFSPSINWTAGWTELQSSHAGSTTTVSGCAYKIADGTEGSSVTVLTSATGYSAHQTFRVTDYTGVPHRSAVTSGTNTTPDADDLATSYDPLPGDDILWLTFFGGSSAAITVSSYPAGYSDGVLTRSAAGNSSIASAQRHTETTTEDAGQFTVSGSIDWKAWTIGIESAKTALVEKHESCAINIAGSDLYASLNNPLYYYYETGTYQDDWVTGYSAGAGSQSKESDHLWLQASTAANAERTYALSSPVNLTDIDTLYIDWSNNGSSSIQNHSYLVVSTDETANYTVYNYRKAPLNAFARTTDSLDVSNASGNYYIRVHAAVSAAVTSEVNVFNIYGVSGEDVVLQIPGFTEGKHSVDAWDNGSTFGIDFDGVTKDSTSSAHWVAVDNGNSYVIANLPYLEYYKHTVNGTLIAWYQPITMIDGTTLPDRQGTAQDGVITWGSNPSGVTVTLGGLTAETTGITTNGTSGGSGYHDPLHEASVSDWFKEPDVGTKLASNPLRPLVTLMSDTTTLTEVQAWRFLGLAILLLVTVSAAAGVSGHLLIAGLACGGTIGVLAQQTIWPGWTLVFIIPAIIAGLLAERTPSIG